MSAYVIPALRKQKSTLNIEEDKEKEKEKETKRIAEELKNKEEELKQHEKEAEEDTTTEGDEFEIILNSVIISQILKNKDMRGELLGFFIKNEELKKKRKRKKAKTTEGTNEDIEEVEEEDDEEEEDMMNSINNKRMGNMNDPKENKMGLNKTSVGVVDVNQSFSIMNNEDIFIHKIGQMINMYQLTQAQGNELFNNVSMYFHKSKLTEEGEKYVSEVNTYYEEYVNILSELNFETTFYGFYININDLHKKEVLVTLLIYSLINKNAFVLCYYEKFGKLVFSAYKLDVDVVFEIRNQIKEGTFHHFDNLLNVDMRKEGINSRNILRKVPIQIQNSIITNLFLSALKSKNKNYVSPDDYLHSVEKNSLQNYVEDMRKSLEHLIHEQEKFAKFKQDCYKQMQIQKIQLEKKQLEMEKNKGENDNVELPKEEITMQSVLQNVPQPSLLFPYVLTMTNNMANDNINNLCSHSIAKCYLHYENSKQ